MHLIPSEALRQGCLLEEEVLIEQGRKPHTLELLLRHNHSTEAMDVTLAVSLEAKHLDFQHKDTVTLKLASTPGEWLGKGLLEHEVHQALSRKVIAEHPGIYVFRVDLLVHPSSINLSLLGYRLIPS